MSPKKLKDLKVVELKAELERRGLDTEGLKAALKDRLREALEAAGKDPEEFIFDDEEPMEEAEAVGETAEAVAEETKAAEETEAVEEETEAVEEETEAAEETKAVEAVAVEEKEEAAGEEADGMEVEEATVAAATAEETPVAEPAVAKEAETTADPEPAAEPEESGEPPAKKSKVAEEARKKIEEAKAKVVAEAEAAEAALKKAKAAELEKFWKAVRDDPTDFTGWTYLLQHVDGKNDLDAGREAFSKFLQRYPYCYGYWKKFSDFEKRNGDVARTMTVFEQGMAAIPLSADLWLHYLAHQKATHASDPSTVRASYERAVSACGREWRSDKLWEHYLAWEGGEQGEPARLLGIYHRLLRVPTQGSGNQLEAACKMVKARSPKELLSTEEFLAMRREVLAAGGAGAGEEPSAAPSTPAVAPGEDDEAALAGEGETDAIREKVVFNLRKIYKETEERVSLRWKFEEGIKRPYFHVKPLERGQLKNWQDYLDFMKVEMAKEGGDITEVEILYERCMIACALYEEFWLDYVKWLDGREDLEAKEREERVRAIYGRAAGHLPTKVELHTRWAAWEERAGGMEEAGRVLEALEGHHPGLLAVIIARVNLERRRGRVPEACRLYEAAILGAKTAAASDLSVKYSRFLRLAQGDAAKAGEVLQTAVDSDPTNPKLYLQQLDLLLHTTPLSIPAVVSLLEKAGAAEGLADKHKLLFAQRKVEFLQDFGPSIALLEAAELEVAGLQKKKAEERKEEPGRAIGTVQGRGGKEKTPNGAAPTSYPAANSAQYGAAQAAAFNQYGARYAGYPQQGSYGQWGYPGYAPQSS